MRGTGSCCCLAVGMSQTAAMQIVMEAGSLDAARRSYFGEHTVIRQLGEILIRLGCRITTPLELEIGVWTFSNVVSGLQSATSRNAGCLAYTSPCHTTRINNNKKNHRHINSGQMILYYSSELSPNIEPFALQNSGCS